jgi:hypothetical protein
VKKGWNEQKGWALMSWSVLWKTEREMWMTCLRIISVERGEKENGGEIVRISMDGNAKD